MRAYVAKNRDRVNARARATYQAEPDRYAKYRFKAKGKHRLKYLYGLTPKARLALLEDTDGLCAICLAEPAVDIDHDHETGYLRGALCGNCNRGLGNFKDDPEILAAAIEYLRRWELSEEVAG